MQLSHSRVQTFVKCPYQYKLRYVDKLTALQKGDPADPLILGHALHTGIEKTVEDAIAEYYAAYSVITDMHENEAIKLEYWLPKIKALLPEGKYEIKIEDDDFIGFIDLLVPVEEYEGNALGRGYPDPGCAVYDLYDFKYSNNVKNYMDSEQLHLYKYYFEKLHPGNEIRNMYFLFVPKTAVRMKYKNKTNPRDETLAEFRKRMIAELEKKDLELVQIPYDPTKVIDFLTSGKHCIECQEFDKNPTKLCQWCDYQRYCEKGENIDMQLPKNERRSIEKIDKKVIWLYGAPFSGKTFLANKFPDPIMLNTDGNIRFVDAPYIPIKDVVTSEGRMTKRQLAWDVFKEAIAELEKKQNDFKTIVVDLVEDTYEACRLYMYDQMGITHESDDSFRAWDKVRTEFLSTIRRLMTLDYENIILISHEDTSKDITKKSGDKITSIKPNINDKCANKLAGMVDIVARVIADGDDRVLSFKTNEVIFGGGRLNVKVNEIPLDYDALMEVYEEANEGTTQPARHTQPIQHAQPAPAQQEVETATQPEQGELETADKPAPRTRTRKNRDAEPAAAAQAPAEEEAAPKRTRRRRTAE